MLSLSLVHEIQYTYSSLSISLMDESNRNDGILSTHSKGEIQLSRMSFVGVIGRRKVSFDENLLTYSHTHAKRRWNLSLLARPMGKLDESNDQTIVVGYTIFFTAS